MSDAGLSVRAPLAGYCASLDDSPDPVFRDRVLGDGVSIDPTCGELVAPFDGTVVNLPDSRHSVTLRSRHAAEILVHVGIDTVGLAGRGFVAHVEAGERVTTGQVLLTFDLDVVARSAPSLRTPVLLLNGDDFSIAGRRGEGMVGAGDEVFVVMRRGEREADEGGRIEASHRERLRVGLPHGIHARPAAEIRRIVLRHDAAVSIVAADGRAASAASPVALMSLGLVRGDPVRLEAGGPDAVTALADIAGFLGVPDGEPKAGANAPAATRTIAAAGERLAGRAAVGGLASGRVFRLADETRELRASSRGVDAELSLLDDALADVRAYLADVVATAGGAGRDIAEAHGLFLEDPDLRARAARRIRSGATAPQAFDAAIAELAVTLAGLDDARMRERAADLRDVNRRVQRALAGEKPDAAVRLPAASIAVAEDLLPSFLIESDRDQLAGIALAGGGATSHAAILAATYDIPMLIGLGDAVLTLQAGMRALLDGDAGWLLPGPDAETARAFERRVATDRSDRERERAAAHRPAETTDGQRIEVLANLSAADDAERAAQNGADGCGLLRSEFLYMNRRDLPGVDEQRAAYQAVSDALPSGPVVVRLLDAGGDKPVAALAHPAEENPALGLRGIRLLLEHRDVLDRQLEALVSVDRAEPVRVLVPMIADADELEAVLDSLAHAGGSRVALGAMIETPAAALIADELAPLVDFFSIGTNDLAQYTLAIDRSAGSLAQRLDPLHPAVLRLVAAVCEAAGRHGKSVSVCGNSAADTAAIPLYVGLGVRQLSVVPASIARTKARVRQLAAADCGALARRALAARSASAVRRLVADALPPGSAPDGENAS